MGSGGDGRSMRERMVAGALYRADDPELVEMSLLVEVGDGAEVRPPLRESAEPVRIGDNVWLGSGMIVLPGVEIGRDTVVGAGVGGDPEPAGRDARYR